MSVISKLKVWIGSDTGALEKGLKKSKKEVSAFSSGMKKLGSMIAGAFAVSSVVSFAKECLSLNKVQADAEKKLAAVIKATGGAAGLTADEMKKYASQLQDLTTYGDEVTIDAMAIMSTFKSIKGDVFKQAVASAQDMATVLNTDLNAAVMQIGKALEAPEIGLTALRRSGVSFSQEQIKQIKQLVAEGKKQEAQLIMLKELQNEFGGAAKAAAGDAYGAATQLTNAWGDLKETIGGMITPSEEAIGTLKDGVKSVNHLITDKSIPAWKKWIGLLTAGFTPLLNMLNFKNLLDETDVNSLREEATQKEIESLKLSEKHLYQLKMLLVGYLNLEDEANLSKDRIIAAINEEIKKRDQGIMAETEAQRIAREAAAAKIKAEQDKKQAIQDTINMEEKSIEAIGKKIKAFQNLKTATDITDRASLDYYNKEISRLNELIRKTEELSMKRRLAAQKDLDGGPVQIRDIYGGLLGAAMDIKSNTFNTNGIEQFLALMNTVDSVIKEVKDEISELATIMQAAIGNMAESFGTGIGKMVASGGSFKDLANTIGSSLGDIIAGIGKTAIAAGTGAIAIKGALKLKNPYAAIAAGIALVALGTAIKSSLSSIANGESVGAISSNKLNSNEINIGETRDLSHALAESKVNVVVSGELKAKGSSLIAAISSENNRRNLTT